MTYYDLLEVSENASFEVIHMAYKALVKKYHPDIFQGDAKIAEEYMKQINTAYGILSDPEKRKHYDSVLQWKRSQEEQEELENSYKNKKAKKKVKKEIQPPSFKRSAITVFFFLFLCFALEVFYYFTMYNLEKYELDYAIFCAFLDSALFAFAYMFFPMLIGAIKKECSMNFIQNMPWINSAIILVATNVIFNQTEGSGWMLAIFYSVINRHILFHMHQKLQKRSHRVVAVCIVLLSFLYVVVGGLFGMSAMF